MIKTPIALILPSEGILKLISPSKLAVKPSENTKSKSTFKPENWFPDWEIVRDDIPNVEKVLISLALLLLPLFSPKKPVVSFEEKV